MEIELKLCTLRRTRNTNGQTDPEPAAAIEKEHRTLGYPSHLLTRNPQHTSSHPLLLTPKRLLRQLQPLRAPFRADPIAIIHDIAIKRPPPMLKELLTNLPIARIEPVLPIDPKPLRLIINIHQQMHNSKRVLCRRRPRLHRLAEYANELGPGRRPRKDIKYGMVRDVLLRLGGLEMRREVRGPLGPQHVRVEGVPDEFAHVEHFCDRGAGFHHFYDVVVEYAIVGHEADRRVRGEGAVCGDYGGGKDCAWAVRLPCCHCCW